MILDRRAMPLREVGVRHRLGARRDRLDDVLVAGAAAEIAFELLADGVVAEVVALALDDVDRGHDHAGGAEAALQTVMLAERFLHRMQRRAVGGEALDGLDLVPVSHHRERGAGLDSLAVEMHDAGAALRGVTADMGAGQPKIFAQKLHQQGAGVDIGVDGIAVHDQGNLGHSALSSSALLHCTAAQSLKSFQRHNMGHPGNEQPHLGAWPGMVRRSSEELASSGNQPCTALAKFAKNSSASFLAEPLISRCPSWASLPPICASTL